jgi:hypothetical protein
MKIPFISKIMDDLKEIRTENNILKKQIAEFTNNLSSVLSEMADMKEHVQYLESKLSDYEVSSPYWKNIDYANDMYRFIPKSQESGNTCEQQYYTGAQSAHGTDGVPYLPTYKFDSDFINANHEKYSLLAQGSGLVKTEYEGWLRPADALKFYELSYLQKGMFCSLTHIKGFQFQ